MNLAQFRAKYPEFNSGPDPLVQVFLDAAALRLDPAIWGTQFDLAQGLLTAHTLAISPNGQFSRLQTDKGMTTYWKDYVELRQGVCAALRIF